MPNPELSAKHQRAVAALLNEPTIRAAAAALGVHERTLHTWLNEPAFEAEYRRVRREAVRHAVAQLQRHAAGAAAALGAIATDPREPTPARVSAAKAVLELALRAIELEDLDARVAALEAATAARTIEGEATR